MRRLLLAVAAVLLLLAAGCAGDTSGGPLDGITYRVGSKEFDEQRILCQMEIAMLRSQGATVVDQCGLVGTNTARQELLAGRIDTYVEYTATGWIVHLGQPDQTRDPVTQFTLVRDADRAQRVVWTAPALRVDTTYAVAVARERGAALHIATLSDLARYANMDSSAATLCVEREFAARPDGFGGMLKAYGFTGSYTNPPALTVQDVGETYGSIQRGDPCAFGEVYRSDGRIVADDLTVLSDDKGYFPKYTPAVVVRQEVYDRAPLIGEVMRPVMEALDDDTLRTLCGQVSVQRRDPIDVATTWLNTHGFPV